MIIFSRVSNSGELEPIPSVIGQKFRYTFDRSGANTERHTTIYTQIYIYGQIWIINRSNTEMY